jgi:hypothetical protein
MTAKSDWKLSKANVFWGEIAPCDHVLQIYEDDNSFLEVLTGFVADGINAGDAVVVIATAIHLQSLESRLKVNGVKIASALSNKTYIPLDAEETLAKFMVDGWPDEDLFMEVVTGLITKAGRGNRKVRAFGEMVALLWAQGNNGATVNLEHLWDKLCASAVFSVFCAYPKSGFTQDAGESIMHICGSHSKMIAASGNPAAGLYYQNIITKEAI